MLLTLIVEVYLKIGLQIIIKIGLHASTDLYDFD